MERPSNDYCTIVRCCGFRPMCFVKSLLGLQLILGEVGIEISVATPIFHE